ncbi:hypothetical protein BKA56DRAFT_599651 [Ilyonectria sp. MPI-CAGE-AT-0026]|nr:hypothetical protein BKA56DRAFT_599651 [Ilyonectria sp. MPI-CAGE-AT-0026]
MSSQTLRPISAGTWDEAAFVSVLDIIRGHNRELPIAESGVAHQPSQPGRLLRLSSGRPGRGTRSPVRKTRGEKRGPIASPNLMAIQRATNYIEEN